MGLVAPLLLVPVEVAVDHLVVLGAVVRPQRGAELADALIAVLLPLVGPGAVGPGVVGQRVGDRFVVLVAEPAIDLTASDRAGGVVPVLAPGIGCVERVIGIDQHRREAGVLVVRAEERKVGGLTR